MQYKWTEWCTWSDCEFCWAFCNQLDTALKSIVFNHLHRTVCNWSESLQCTWTPSVIVHTFCNRFFRYPPIVRLKSNLYKICFNMQRNNITKQHIHCIKKVYYPTTNNDFNSSCLIPVIFATNIAERICHWNVIFLYHMLNVHTLPWETLATRKSHFSSKVTSFWEKKRYLHFICPWFFFNLIRSPQ